MDSIAVIDFGSQYAHLIANRVRRLGVYAEIFLPETPVAVLSKYKGLILSGGPRSVYEAGAPTIDKRIFSLGIPILGLCYGHQLMAHTLGGKVDPGATKEYGLAKLTVLKKLGIFEGIRDHTQVWMSHGDTVTHLAPGFIQLGKTHDCQYAAVANPEKKFFSTQFHVEVTHTVEGMKMLDNFLNVCRVKREWNMDRFLSQKMAQIKRQLAGRKVFLLVSGGVDSTVAYAMLSKALGTENVYGLFVDTGLLRKNEVAHIKAIFAKIGIKNFHVFSAAGRFLKALAGVIHPEEKRKIIGDLFLELQAHAVRALKLNPSEWVLGQGTIYPDTIESAGTMHADKIKTHHNRVPEILELIKKGQLIEPLAELYKDEVRQLGVRLGLPDEVIWKHPFPGPGLGVRMLCVYKEQLPEDISDVEDKIAQYLAPHHIFGKILPIQSVGVQGDARTYRNPIALWNYHASSKHQRRSFDELENISTNLTNHFSAINRVCLLLAPKQITSIKLLPASITARRLKLLCELDDIVMKFIKKHGIEREIWQFPTVLIPLSINGIKKEAVVLRPICSEEAMTANFYKMNFELLKKLTSKLAPKVSAVFYDITNKPPGTIEWE